MANNQIGKEGQRYLNCSCQRGGDSHKLGKNNQVWKRLTPCEPYLEAQKLTVDGVTRIGLVASKEGAGVVPGEPVENIQRAEYVNI